jgi:predicted nuclease of predicted toxin-antitoxin system
MKILLDENIDVRLKHHFPDIYDVYTVRDMQWNGIMNGELLLLLKKNAFDAWIVVDKNIPHQQNINNFPCRVIVLDAYRNTLKHLLPLIPQVLEALINEADKIIIVK